MRYLVWFALPFAASALLACNLPAWWLCWPVLGLSLAVGLVLRMALDKGRAAVTLVCAGVSAAMLWFGVYTAAMVLPVETLHGQTAGFTATVTAYPEETDYGCKVRVRLDSGEVTGAKAVLYLYDDYSHLRPGDEVTGSGRFTSTVTAGRSYFSCEGVFLTANAALTQVYRPTEEVPLRYFPQVLGQKLLDTIDTLFAQEPAALLRSLITGDRSRLSDGVYSDFRRSGMAHLLAVSGLHIGFLVCFFCALPMPGRVRCAVAIPILVLFVLMIGSPPSAWRAVIMAAIVLLAPLLRREPDPLSSLAFALVILLVHNPYAIQSVSLQLSFAAVAGLACFNRRLYDWLVKPAAKWNKRLFRVKLWKGIAGSLSVSCSAMVFTLPLMALHFDTLSLVSPLSNLLCLPLATLCFCGGLVLSLLSWVWLPAAQWLALLFGFVTQLLSAAAHLLSAIPYSNLVLDNFYARLWLWATFAIVMLVVCLKPLRARPVLPIAASASLLFLGLALNMLTAQSTAFSVTALDVGQGSCTVFLSEGAFVAVDCGGSDAGDTLADHLNSAGETKLDLLVLTHYDDDHADGVEQLLRRVKVDCIALPDTADETGSRAEIEALARYYGTSLRWVDQTFAVTFGAAELYIYPPVSEASDNAGCIAVLAHWQGHRVLVTGDLPGEQEQALMEREGLEDVEVLVVGHHGASSSTCDALVAGLRPDYALISVGDNQYYLPSDEVVERLISYRCAVYRTDQNGSVTIRFREE